MKGFLFLNIMHNSNWTSENAKESIILLVLIKFWENSNEAILSYAGLTIDLNSLTRNKSTIFSLAELTYCTLSSKVSLSTIS